MHHQNSKSIDDSIDSLSRDDTISLSMQDSTADSDIQKKHKSLVPHVHRTFQSLSLSCKQSPSQDSDVWHSESEANWTTVGNPLKDITQSQVLSEDEAKVIESGGHPLSPTTDRAVSQDASKGVTEVDIHHDVESGKKMPPVAYGFEPPRSTDIFGVCSWNSLCLALNSNMLQGTKGVDDISYMMCTL